MNISAFIRRYGIGLLIAGLLGVIVWWFYDPLLAFYHTLADRETIKQYVASWGAFAPVIFILIQILQVIFAPVPGEVTGFVGGYLFGAVKGFVFSSIGLAVGSAVNFWIGRFFGYRLVRKLIPPAHLQKLDAFMAHQGIIILLLIFMFPGFPKDYLCLFLGLTALPFNIFILLAAFGRMPGTLMLSLQGQLLFTRNYWASGVILLVCLGIAVITVTYKEAIYRWVERKSKKKGPG